MTDQIDPGAAALGGAIVTAGLAWLGNRMLGKAAIQAAVNAGFKELMDQMRLELKAALRAQAETEVKNVELEGEVRQLQAVIDGMDRFIRSKGHEPPAWRRTLNTVEG
jgi:hypothetical protein